MMGWDSKNQAHREVFRHVGIAYGLYGFLVGMQKLVSGSISGLCFEKFGFPKL